MHSLHAISRKVAKTRYNIRLCRQPQSSHGINSVPVLMLCLSVDCTNLPVQYSSCAWVWTALSSCAWVWTALSSCAWVWTALSSCAWVWTALSSCAWVWTALSSCAWVWTALSSCAWVWTALSSYTNILAVTHYLAIQYPCCHPLSCYTISLLSSTILLYNTVFTFGCRLHCLAIQISLLSPTIFLYKYPCCHPLSCNTISLLPPTVLLYNILAFIHYLAVQYRLHIWV